MGKINPEVFTPSQDAGSAEENDDGPDNEESPEKEEEKGKGWLVKDGRDVCREANPRTEREEGVNPNPNRIDFVMTAHALVSRAEGRSLG